MEPSSTCARSLFAHQSVRSHVLESPRDGVFKGAINAVTQTPDGYLWLGTDFGLVRFDGVAAVPWQPPSHASLAGRPVIRLLTTRDGTLWIGTDLGLTSQKAGKLTEYPELANERVSVLVEDREGTVWAGSAGTPYGRLCAVQNGTARCHGEDGTLGDAIAGMYEEKTAATFGLALRMGYGDGCPTVRISILFPITRAASALWARTMTARF